MGTAAIPLDEGAVAARLAAELPRWSLVDGSIRRTYRVTGWKSALVVATTIGHLAEAAWHHPELVLGYGRVEVRLTSHDAGGVTERDLALAARIEDVVAWHPTPDTGPFDGTPDDRRHAHVRRET